jgi:hydrophobic/amphiphilic exporter-1 (mainly G- bacteria), HAE1 family
MITFGIRKPITTLMIVIGIFLFTAVGLARIPVELYPNTESSQVSVITRLRGGIAATEVEKNVTKPLEAVFAEINGLRELTSASRESESNIILDFYPGVKTDFAVIDIREKLASVRHLLPREVEKPIIAKFQQFDIPILIITLSSQSHTPEELRDVAEEKAKDRLMRIGGVANVEIGGGRERKFLIELDNSRLLAYKLPILQVVEKINLSNISVSAGDIVERNSKYLIRTTGEYKSIDEIRNTGIAITQAGSVIRIKDIGEVRDSYFEATSFARLDQRPVVSIYIQKESSANTIKVSKDVLRELNALKPALAAEGIVIDVVKNDAEFITSAITSLEHSLLLSALIVSLVLFFFLKDRRTIAIIVCTIPLSLFLAIMLIFLSGLTFNIMTLSGLALGVGMLMDNAIIILDNIARHSRKKSFPTREELIVGSTRELIKPIIASTLCTTIVFLPLVFIDPEIRQLYVPFALTITFALFASMLSTLVFIPPLTLRFQKDISGQIPGWFARVHKKYRRLLGFVFRHRMQVFSGIIVLLLFSILILSHKDSEFIDTGRANTFRVGIQFPPATRIEHSDEIVKKIEKALSEYKGVKRISSKVEKLHTFVEVETDSNPELVKKEFRKRLTEFTPAFVYFQESQSEVTKEIFVDLFGYDYDVLKQIAFAASGRLSQIKDLTDVKIRMREDEPEVHLTIDRGKLTLFNLTTLYLGNVLHCQLRGLVATYYRSEGREIETICRLFPGTVKSVKELPFLGIVSPKGDVLTLGQLGDISQVKATQEIWHKNKKRFIQLSADRGKLGLTTAINKMKEKLSSLSFPRDYKYDFPGDYKKTQENKRQFSLALLLTIILIYFVLSSLYESYYQSVLIMVVLPLAVIGVSFILWVTRKPISLGVWMGFMILFGMVVNSSIILVEKININKRKHSNTIRAILTACDERLRSILMTSINTTLGLVPLVLNTSSSSEMWRSLGLTIIGGMISGTILTLFVIPILYLSAEQLLGNWSTTSVFVWQEAFAFGKFGKMISGLRPALMRHPAPKAEGPEVPGPGVEELITGGPRPSWFKLKAIMLSELFEKYNQIAKHKFFQFVQYIRSFFAKDSD